MKIEITSNPIDADNEFVINQTREYNQQFVEKDAESLFVFARNDAGEMIGGLVGKTYWKWLHVEFLWVNESNRGSKLGRKLLQSAEEEARGRGCTGSTLDTFSFQALGFYEKLGYSKVGMLSGYSGKHERFYMEKLIG